ncbi:unnamed protein product [Heterobilharzia americana]|nr:unnamed protein product [Heterobilharzia americana]
MRHLQISPHSSNSHCCQSLKHYRVLLWKDYLLRRRSFWLILAELMFCLVFVIVIAVIRGRYSAENMSSCYIQSQSMTSMGLLTYMQSLICNFNYTCYDKIHRVLLH